MGNTGKKIYRLLKQVTISGGTPTGLYKLNDPGDPDYVQPVVDYDICPVLVWRPVNPSCQLSEGTNTGYVIYNQRERVQNGEVTLIEDNVEGSGIGPYFPSVYNEFICPPLTTDFNG